MTPPEITAIRNGTEPDKPGWYVRVVPNKFPALRVEGELGPTDNGLYRALNGIGAHEVIIESPNHADDLAFLSEEQIIRIISVCRQRVEDLQRDARFRHVAVFRNHRHAAGATLRHPHSQVIALPIIPNLVYAKLVGAAAYHDRTGRCIFCDIIAQELDIGDRMILATDHFVALAPYASAFAYSSTIYPRRHCHEMTTLTVEEQADLAGVLRRLLMSYRSAAFNPPYNLIYQTAPNVVPGPESPPQSDKLDLHYHWHIEVTPRISAASGLERGTGFYLNPMAPEEAAADLRDNLL